MTHRLIIIISIALLSLADSSLRAQEEETINMLFIGNSFTFRHDLNLLVEEIVHEGKPNLKIYTERSVYGGQSLFQHSEYYFSQTFIEQSTIEDAEIEGRIAEMEKLLELTVVPPEFIHFWRDIRGQQVQDFPVSNIENAIKRHRDLLANNPRRKWDYVVLQTWQDEYPDLNDGYAKYAKYLGNIAREQGAKVIFYMTAPDFQNEAPVSGPVKQEDYEEQIGIMIELAQEFQPFAVIPVSMAINRIQQGGTDLTFRYVNDFHPNQRTAFLTTNMLYDALFKESTEGFNFNTVTETNPKGMEPGQDPDGNPATVVFGEDEKIYLQQMAFNVLMDFEDIWKRTSVSGVSITNAPSGDVFLGENYQLHARLDPVYSTNKELSWEVISGDAVAVDENGLLTTLAIGTAIVQVTTMDGGFSDSCEIKVSLVPVSSVHLNNCPGYLLEIGDTLCLSAFILPENAANKSVTWDSSDTLIAAVDSIGLITAKSTGIATITVTTMDGGHKSTCRFGVNFPDVPVTGVSLTGCVSDDLIVGDYRQLGAVISPDDATDLSVSWSSSDTSVARVSAYGMVTTFSEGNATISVSANDGGFTDECSITVLDSLSSSSSTHLGVSLNGINLYPNPVEDMLHIIFPDAILEKRLRIFNLQGQSLANAETFDDHFDLDLEKISRQSLLLVEISHGDEMFFYKIMTN